MAEAVTVRDLGSLGMITLRGDLADPALRAVTEDVGGQPMPGPGQAHVAALRGLCWMSPDEVMILLPRDQVAAALARVAVALAGTHHLGADVSDARAVFAVEGAGAAEVLAKLAPVDLHTDHFPVGGFRRTRLGQIAGAFWREEERFVVICFRSVADYALNLLTVSARDGPVGHF